MRLTLLTPWTLWLGLALAAATPLPAAAEPPPIAAFFKRPAIRSPDLSPSGRHLAVLVPSKNDRTVLAVIDLQAPAAPKIVAGFQDADIARHEWVTEDRLVFQASNSPDGSTQVMAEGLWAVDRDGSNTRQLIKSDQEWVTNDPGRLIDRRLDINWTFDGVVPGGSGEVFVLRRRWASESESTSAQLARLDTRSGQLRNLSQGLPEHVTSWWVDWRGEPRAVSATAAGRQRLYQHQADGSWKLWQEEDSLAQRQFKPYWFGPDGQTLVIDNWKGYTAVFKLDPQTQTRASEPLISFKGYDYRGALIFDPQAQRLLGLHYETDAPGTVWLDARMKALQADIDTQLPGSVNQINCERCLDAAQLVVTAWSDQQPAAYYLYKPADRQLLPLAGLRADLPTNAMGQRDYHRIKARDGLEMPVLVTQPAGGVGPQARPTIVLVHGGPYVRGTHWRWEPDAQFLASRGYLVLEPEFRGSTGFGYAHFRAGWKQWGLAMQNDLGDTLAWAVKQGWADPKRACIMGASYGGYAAMMAAVVQGDLFQCAVNWVGVTDLGLMSSINWSDASDEWKGYGMKRLVADPATDAEQMRTTSPLLRAKEIRMPLLMAYGGTDRRVPLKHGTEMKAALRPDQALDWVVYPDEGHGWFNLKTNVDFWSRVERFLATNLAPKP